MPFLKQLTQPTDQFGQKKRKIPSFATPASPGGLTTAISGPRKPPTTSLAQQAAATAVQPRPQAIPQVNVRPPRPQAAPQVAPQASPQPTPQVTPFRLPQRPADQVQQSQLKALQDRFAQTARPTTEEFGIQQQLSGVLSGEELGLQQIGQQPIATQFITGQQAALQRQAATQAAPLQRQLALLQQQRTGERDVAEELLGFQQADVTAREGEQQSLRQLAQSVIEQGGTQEQVNQILGAGSIDQALSAVAGGGLLRQQAEAPTSVVQAGGRSQLINTQTGEIIRDLGATEGALARSAKAQSDAQKALQEGEDVSPFLKELGKTATGVVTDLRGRIALNTVGPVAALSAPIPGTDSFDFAVDLETLKADIGFGILQQMREASKTGGALGQVSERELSFLQATLGSLNQFQSPANFKKNLEKVQSSINRWTSAVEENEGTGSFTTSGGNQVTVTEI